DREHGIVAKHAKGGDKLGPPLGAVAVTAGAEDPGALALRGVGLSIEHAGARQIDRVKLRVFGMDVEDRVFGLKNADGGDGINILPEKMAGIEVTTYGRSGDGAQLEHRLRTIDYEAGMHFDGDLHAMIRGELRVLDPIGRDDFVP